MFYHIVHDVLPELLIRNDTDNALQILSDLAQQGLKISFRQLKAVHLYLRHLKALVLQHLRILEVRTKLFEIHSSLVEKFIHFLYELLGSFILKSVDVLLTLLLECLADVVLVVDLNVHFL